MNLWEGWLLDKGNNLEGAVVHTLPIADEMGTMDDTTNDDKGKEGAV